MTSSGSLQTPPRLLLTAGPTHEPIDSVRYIANRSSGRLGVAIADEAARRGWRTTMLLGPSCFVPENTSVELHRFRTTTDLQGLLAEHFPACDILIMAAAVADYRVASPLTDAKVQRGAQPLTLMLEPTPDLLAGLAPLRRPEQRVVGFALEPKERLLESARAKLIRKGLEAIVANPLDAMDSDQIDATLLTRDGASLTPGQSTPKDQFARWLLDAIERL